MNVDRLELGIASRELSLGQHVVTMLTPFEPAPYEVNGEKHHGHYSHEADDDPGGVLGPHIF